MDWETPNTKLLPSLTIKASKPYLGSLYNQHDLLLVFGTAV